MAGNIALCYWAKHLTLTVPFSTKMNQWVSAKLMLGVTLRWTSISSGELGEYKYSSSLHATKTGISSGLMNRRRKQLNLYKLKVATSWLNGLRSFSISLFLPSLTILVPLWFTIVSLVFFYLCKVLFQVSLNLTVILSMVKITQNALNVLL